MSAQRKPAAYDNNWLGNMNATFQARMSIPGRRDFVPSGSTPRDIAQAAHREHVAPGTIVLINYGLGWESWRIVSAPHDTRAGGLWAESVR